MKKGWIFVLVLMLLAGLSAGSAEEAQSARKTVFYPSEREMFSPETDTLELFVAPLLGADCMCLRCGGETMLVDTGKKSNYDDVKAMLDGLGVTEFKYIFISHPHEDHIGAFPFLVRDYQVENFLTMFPRDFKRPFSHHLAAVEAADEAGVPITVMQDGDSFTLGGAKLDVIQYTQTDDLNKLSGVLLVTFGERRLLLTGDCDSVAGLTLSQTRDLHAEILKFPHHGIGYVDPEEIENIAPEFVIFPHGFFNTEKSQKILNRYHIPFCFATWGVIHAATDGEVWIVEQTLSEDGVNMMNKYGEVEGVWD